MNAFLSGPQIVDTIERGALRYVGSSVARSIGVPAVIVLAIGGALWRRARPGARRPGARR